MINNGKISMRVTGGARPRFTLRIQDPDGVDNFWIYKMDNNGQWVPFLFGKGNCDTDVVLTWIVANFQNAAFDYKIIYKDCQSTPAFEVWETHITIPNKWTDGYRKDSGYGDEFIPEEEFPDNIEPEPWWKKWWWLLGAIILFGIAVGSILKKQQAEE